MATFLGGRGSGDGFVRDVDSALRQVPGVVSTTTTYNENAGKSTRINVRIAAAAGADLQSVLDGTLRAFAKAAGSTRGTVSVAYYVFAEGAEKDGIRPAALGLGITPTVDEIRKYAGSGR